MTNAATRLTRAVGRSLAQPVEPRAGGRADQQRPGRNRVGVGEHIGFIEHEEASGFSSR